MASVWKRKNARPGARWFISYAIRPGVYRTVGGLSDFRLTEQLAAKLEYDAALRERGFIDPAMEKLADYAKRDIHEFIDEFELYLESKRNSVQHVMETLALIEDVAEQCKWQTISHIDGPQLSQDLGRLIAAGGSARTANKRRGAVRGFVRWLVREGRLRIDPLAGVAAIRERDDVRVKRRALMDEESARLLAAAERGDVLYKLTGTQRMWMYRTALETGLRAGELLSLTPRNFNLRRRLVVLDARNSKRRQKDEQPVPADFCIEIAAWLGQHDIDQKLWPTTHNYTSRMVKADLKAADIDPVDHGEGRLDFHALRHSFITRLMRANVPPKVMQKLARHSTVQLTLDRYSHLALSDPAAAIDALPALRMKQKMRKTGS